MLYMKDSIERKDFRLHLIQFSDLQLSEKSRFFTFYFKLFFGIFKLFDHLTKQTKQLNNYNEVEKTNDTLFKRPITLKVRGRLFFPLKT